MTNSIEGGKTLLGQVVEKQNIGTVFVAPPHREGESHLLIFTDESKGRSFWEVDPKSGKIVIVGLEDNTTTPAQVIPISPIAAEIIQTIIKNK